MTAPNCPADEAVAAGNPKSLVPVGMDDGGDPDRGSVSWLEPTDVTQGGVLP